MGKKRDKESEEENTQNKRRRTFQPDGNNRTIHNQSNDTSVSGEEGRLSEGSPTLVINPQASGTPNEHSKLRLEGLPSNLDPGGVRIVPFSCHFSTKNPKKSKKFKKSKKL